jgi:hypothetical protein
MSFFTSSGRPRGRSIALLVAGLLAGTVLIQPAVGHVTRRLNHLYKHLDKRYVKVGDTVAQARNATNATNATNAANADSLDGKDSTAYEQKSETMTGVFSARGGHAGGGSNFADTQISWDIPLSVAPTPHYIPTGGTPPAACPGSAANPQAQAGNLCVYEGDTAGSAITTVCIVSPLNYSCPPNAASRFGADIFFNSSGTDFIVLGTWAVTPTTATGRIADQPAPSPGREGDTDPRS